MNFRCQESALLDLQKLCSGDRHSVLIEGVSGSGKTYLAMQYASMLQVADFQLIEPTVQAVKSAIDECCKLDNSVVLCIENLDTGVAAASYAILKFLEEPNPNIYIVVTCRNIHNIPDTIISRSVCVVTSPPIGADLANYAECKDITKYLERKNLVIWRCVRTFKDVDIVLNLTDSQLSYFDDLNKLICFKDSVSNMMWTLGHYSDSTETPIDLVIRYLIEISDSSYVRSAGIKCIQELNSARIASHAVIARFLFEVKYCE